MDRITDILVVVNPLVRDQPAITKAATLARWLGASIELLIAIPWTRATRVWKDRCRGSAMRFSTTI